ncbi:MAG TPA: YceI family protein [Chryseosolibacter sp.]|nr:YceI family protein [Chryseosolibacter sp.]
MIPFAKYLYLLVLFSAIHPVCAQALTAIDSLSSIEFRIRNFGMMVEGTLSGLEGTVNLDLQHPPRSQVTLSAKALTIETGISLRDKHLQKKEYFDGDSFPYLKFVSENISKAGGRWMITGHLHIKKTAMLVSVPVTVNEEKDAWYLRGHFSINRLDFGVGPKSLALADDVAVNFVIAAKRDESQK